MYLIILRIYKSSDHYHKQQIKRLNMILGNGIDIIDINRIRRVIDKYGNKFKKRCFLNNEILLTSFCGSSFC